jgi:hypothetical protein
MPSNRTPNLSALLEKRRKLDQDIAATQETLAKAIGAPFVKRMGSDFTPKEATQLAELVAQHGAEKSISLLAR